MPFTLYFPSGPASRLIGGCSTSGPDVAGVGSAVGAAGPESGEDAGAAAGAGADGPDWSESVFCSVG